jgi:hypothetical protein
MQLLLPVKDILADDVLLCMVGISASRTSTLCIETNVDEADE